VELARIRSFFGDAPYVQSFSTAGHPLWRSCSATWHSIGIRGERSQTGIGLDRTVEAGRSTFVTRHRAQERMSLQWRETVSSSLIAVFPILADPDKNNLQSAQLLIGREVVSGQMDGCRASVLHSSCRDRPKLRRLQYYSQYPVICAPVICHVLYNWEDRDRQFPREPSTDLAIVFGNVAQTEGIGKT